ncbi:MORN repeat-containing protein 1 [Colius striatus]|uniref:MORN repeat-containing protein 1 n=1 Tax=Colius striatus TaxID=57412 RepID=UPI002B1D35EF|nr:MORN repeat-containing protein 1 [Colius striatus]
MNKDNYNGTWILDKCQGCGISCSAVGTVYEGQWRNDIFNEQGAIVNCSGDICDGLWINGYPTDLNVSPQRKRSRKLEIQHTYMYSWCQAAKCMGWNSDLCSSPS